MLLSFDIGSSDDEPEPLKRRIAHLLPPDDGGVEPMRWNRIPDFGRLAA